MHAVSHGYRNIDPEAFHDYYSAKGWMLDSAWNFKHRTGDKKFKQSVCAVRTFALS